MTGEHNKTQAKRTRMRGEERREFILNRAKEVFARCGYADASTGELARTSEVTEPISLLKKSLLSLQGNA